MFVDKVRITIKAGDGGNGCSSFRREKFIPYGGPNGGDGGNGGSVIVIAESNEQTLVDYVYQTNYQAEKGENGRGKDQYGKCGKNIILKVPPGTVVRDLNDEGKVICDLEELGKPFILAQGGIGGRGNIHFASSTNRAPRRCDPGTKGEQKKLELELKTIADVGLVGFPNAGKSTLLGAVSAAKPKVAPYPFTTLHPIVGTVDFDDFFRITVADIPGLIDGAHNNIGLGHSFLKHIERTKILLYVIDMSGQEGIDPIENYKSLKNELELYMKGLSMRPSLIAANKMDLPDSKENLEKFKEEVYETQIVPISASLKENTDELLKVLKTKVERIKSK
ncbi:MAG TPA: GTPase ObgE [Lentisphaeria bacterium]|nr:MAG: hypothetical protein A2X47_00855 [Lentisphaerae bacterium GWF2_38_69]HBM17519.1 GTPase ObgE [Lentisphaeria bacterium]